MMRDRVRAIVRVGGERQVRRVKDYRMKVPQRARGKREVKRKRRQDNGASKSKERA